VNKTWQKAAAYYLKLSEQRLNTMIISSPVGLKETEMRELIKRNEALMKSVAEGTATRADREALEAVTKRKEELDKELGETKARETKAKFRQSELALAWKSGRAGPAPFVIGHGGPVRKSLAKRHARHAEANTKAACKAVPRCKPSAAQLHPTKLELPLPFPDTKPLSSTGVSLITQTPPDSDFFRLLGVQKSSPLEPLLIFSAYSAPRFHFAAATSVPVSAS
jgi:hypothetical protein